MDLYQSGLTNGQLQPTHQPLPPHASSSLQHLNSTTNLTIRLINNTRLLLPITACQTVMESPSLNESRRESLYACSIDWNQVKLVHNVSSIRDHQQTFISHMSHLNSHDKWSNDRMITYDFLRYSYLSINSLLAICGILVNLFIILILLFNLKQRRRSTGSNMAAKNNLLLFQLTITGIILGTYILIDNMNMCSQINHYASLDSDQLCHRPLMALPVPLLTFLPRTYFHWTTKVNDFSTSEICSSPVIILKYLTNVSLSEIDAAGGESFRYADLGLPMENGTKLFSNDSMEISTAMLRSQGAKDNNSSLPRTTFSSSKTNKSLKLMLILGALPLFVNVIASAHIWTVAALAHDRYRAIAHPFQYLKSVHTSRTKTFFVLSWLVLLILNLVLPITTVNETSAAGHEPGFRENSSMTHWYSWLLEWLMRIHQMDYTTSHLGHMQTTSSANLISLDEVHCDTSAASLATQLASLLREPTGTPNHSTTNKSLNNEMHVIMLIVLSFMGFLTVILLPLIIITICNIGIFRIVKVHERRLSFSSSTTVAASNLTLQQQQQQQSKQVSPIVQMDLHQQMMMRREITERAAILDKQVALTRQIIRFGSANKRSPQGEESMDSPTEAPLGFDGGARIDRKQVGLSSSESLLASSRNCSSSPGGESYRGVIMETGSETGQRGSCEDISRYHGSVSRRVSSGEESCYGMANNDPNSKESLINHESVATIYRYLKSVSSNPAPAHQRPSSATRKTSDSGLVMGAHDESTQQHMSDSDLESPTLSNSPSCLFRERNSSGSILNQLKLAGLSFAGIAIQQPSTGTNSRRVMHKSSSTCSFAGFQSNMNWNYRQPSCEQSASSRASYDSSFAAVPTKRSYVSLNGSLKQYDDFSTNKYKTKLLDEPQPFYTTPIQTTSRLTLSFGTKSAIFNILVWLIMTLLLLTLPHYLFSISKPITRLSFFEGAFGETESAKSQVKDYFTQSMCKIFKLFTRHDNNVGETDLCLGGEEEQTHFVDRYLGTLIVESITVCLACLCRLLFLIIIPLNGCLYGFSSRSFRTTIKMILKRYISKKQASIEINQRHRPLSAMHQRASSCSNFSSMVHDGRSGDGTPKKSTSLKQLFSSWKFLKDVKLESNSGFKERKGSPNFTVNMDYTGSEANTKTVLPPQISLDDSYCQSNSHNDAGNLNLLTSSLNSSLSLACCLIDIEDISYLRENRSNCQKKQQLVHRHNMAKRARAASISSFGQFVQTTPKRTKTPPPIPAHNFRSKSFDYGRNNSLLSGYVSGRINKHRTRINSTPSRKLRRSSFGFENGYPGRSRDSNWKSPAKAGNSFWERFKDGIAALIRIDGLRLFRDDKRSRNTSPSDHPPENQCNVALLGRNSSGNQHSYTFKADENKWFIGESRQRNLSNSLTLDSINSDTSNSIGEPICCVIRAPVQHSKDQSKNSQSSSTTTRDKNGLYLKPPTFLKLSLDMRGQMNHAYRITSTLSPIRESSSNHSYASSQSSLTNNASKTLNNWTTTLPDTPNDQARSPSMIR